MKKYLLIGLIISLAFITRFYMLGSAPKGLYLDEAGQGYSAYSLLKTGKDEFGMPIPSIFRSFTDFKTPVYIYLITPLIPVFGLTAFAVRFPSFIFSIATIPVLYLLIKHITPKKYSKALPFLVILLLAISPWHILFGRTNFECNVALFFMISGIYSFYLSLRRPYLLIIAALLFAIAIPAYHAQRVVTPFIMLFLFIRHRRIVLSNAHKKYVLVGGILALLILLPTLRVATTPGFLARATLNIFSWEKQKPAGFVENAPPVVNSPAFLSSIEFLSLYTSYFSPRNMFNLGDYGPRSSYPELATFFVWQLPFYVYGLYRLIKNKGLGELRFLTLALLLIAPIPAAVTRDPYTTIRALQMTVPLLIIISIGLIDALAKVESRTMRFGIYGVFGVTVVYSILKLYSSGIILNEYFRGQHWNYGWEQAAQIIQKTDQNLPVVVDNSRDEPYIQLAFFLKYDPELYQKENFEVTNEEYYTNMNRNKEKHIGRIVTRPIEWEKDLKISQYLVGDELAISLQQIAEHKLELIEEIDYPDGSVAIRIVKTNPN